MSDRVFYIKIYAVDERIVNIERCRLFLEFLLFQTEVKNQLFYVLRVFSVINRACVVQKGSNLDSDTRNNPPLVKWVQFRPKPNRNPNRYKEL